LRMSGSMPVPIFHISHEGLYTGVNRPVLAERFSCLAH
jgi:hypothetical protein